MQDEPGIPCTECGRVIRTDEIAWQKLDGRYVCADCFYANQSGLIYDVVREYER